MNFLSNTDFDRRFVLGGLLPSVAFFVALVAVWKLGTEPLPLTLWSSNDPIPWIPISILVVAAVLLAVVMSAAPSGCLALYAGQWGTPIGRRAARWRVNAHRKKLDKLRASAGVGGAAVQDARAELRRLTEYPSDTAIAPVRPTSLGNVLQNLVQYLDTRYGIDGAQVWPRLYPLLPEKSVKDLAAVSTNLSLMLTLTTLSSILALFSVVLAITVGRNVIASLLAAAGLFLLALIFHRAAFSAALLYTQQLRVAFDVHRRLLLVQLGFRTVTGIDEETRTWEQLCLFWARAAPFNAQRSW